MPITARELVEQASREAPKEFIRVKRIRNYAGVAIIAVLVLSEILRYYFRGSADCLLPIFAVLAMVLIVVWLRETWKCPVCYESPGFILDSPRFCNACGTRLEE